MEVVARQLLLLYVSLSSPESMGMQGACEGSFTSSISIIYTVLLSLVTDSANIYLFICNT